MDTPVESASTSQGQGDGTKSALELAHGALEANKKLQQALAERARNLEAELERMDRLLAASSTEDGDDDPECEVSIPGAKKAVGLFASSELLNPASPFYEEAQKRSTYLANTNPRPMKSKDLEALANAVKRENERLEAYRTSFNLQRLSTEKPLELVTNIDGLDWTTIAEWVSDASSVKRTAVDCRTVWIGDQHPRFNHAEWTSEEVSKLNTLLSTYVQKKETVNWVSVAEQLGTNRTPIDCLRRGLPRHRFNWTAELDQKLVQAVKSCGVDNWQLVARKVSEYATAAQCQTRWTKSLDPKLKRGAWTENEDNRLRNAVAGFGTSWIQVATAIPGRTNDQCRERWLEHVNADTSQNTWTEEEDRILQQSIKELGNQWKVISLKIGNKKTGQACRQRYEKLKRLQQKNQLNAVPGPSTSPSIPTPSIPSSSTSSAQNTREETAIPISDTLSVPAKTRKAVRKGKEKEIQPNTSAQEAQSSTAILETTPPVGSLEVPDARPIADSPTAPKPIPRPRPKPRPKVIKDLGPAAVPVDAVQATTNSSPGAITLQAPDAVDSPASVSSTGRKRKAVESPQTEDTALPKKTRTSRMRFKGQDAGATSEAPTATEAMSNLDAVNDQEATDAPQPRRSGRARKATTLAQCS